MKNFKKVLAVLLTAILAVSVFAGCSANKENAGNTGSASEKVAILQYMPHSSLDNCTQGLKMHLIKQESLMMSRSVQAEVPIRIARVMHSRW